MPHKHTDTDSNHDVVEVINKHLMAMFDDLEAGNYCPECAMIQLVVSATATILRDQPKDFNSMIAFHALCGRLYAEAIDRGSVTEHYTPTAKKGMN